MWIFWTFRTSNVPALYKRIENLSLSIVNNCAPYRDIVNANSRTTNSNIHLIKLSSGVGAWFAVGLFGRRESVRPSAQNSHPEPAAYIYNRARARAREYGARITPFLPVKHRQEIRNNHHLAKNELPFKWTPPPLRGRLVRISTAYETFLV